MNPTRLALLVLPFLLGVSASCEERRYDFECTGTWGRGDKEISKETYRYEQLLSENEATRRCSEDMMKDRPKRGKTAKCECNGK